MRLVDVEGLSPKKGLLERAFDAMFNPRGIENAPTLKINGPSGPPPLDVRGAMAKLLGWETPPPERGPHPGNSAWGMGNEQPRPSAREQLDRDVVLAPADAVDTVLNTGHSLATTLDGANQGDPAEALNGGLGVLAGVATVGGLGIFARASIRGIRGRGAHRQPQSGRRRPSQKKQDVEKGAEPEPQGVSQKPKSSLIAPDSELPKLSEELAAKIQKARAKRGVEQLEEGTDKRVIQTAEDALKTSYQQARDLGIDMTDFQIEVLELNQATKKVVDRPGVKAGTIGYVEGNSVVGSARSGLGIVRLGDETFLVKMKNSSAQQPENASLQEVLGRFGHAN